MWSHVFLNTLPWLQISTQTFQASACLAMPVSILHLSAIVFLSNGLLSKFTAYKELYTSCAIVFRQSSHSNYAIVSL